MANRPPSLSPQSPQSPAPDTDSNGHELRMSLIDHLLELRSRLVKAFIGLGVGVVLGIALTEPIFYVLMEPFKQVGGVALTTLAPTDSIVSYLRVSLLIGAILAMPLMTYQVLMFIVPGLTPKERRILLGSLPAVMCLFLVGVGFAWFVMLPPALDILANFQTDIFRPQWTADLYLGFVTALLFWMGVAFQTPLIFFVLSILGFVRAGTLIRHWRLAIVGASIAAAIITPTVDPVNMLLVMVPLLGLYIFSVFLVFIGSRRFNRNTTTP